VPYVTSALSYVSVYWSCLKLSCGFYRYPGVKRMSGCVLRDMEAHGELCGTIVLVYVMMVQIRLQFNVSPAAFEVMKLSTSLCGFDMEVLPCRRIIREPEYVHSYRNC
jgi:hypothetical protein